MKELLRKLFGDVEIETIIKKINGRKLKQTERNYLYRSIRPKLIAANFVAQEKILEKINKNKIEDLHLIEYNLSIYGAPLISLKKKKAKKIAIEELIIRILTKAPYARFIEAIPFILIKNKVNKFKLLELASGYDVKNKLGYLIETAIMIKQIPYLEDLLLYLKKNKDKEKSFLVEGDYDLLIKTSPLRIRKWNLFGRFFDKDFMENAKVYL